jgi:hypothetical protein
VFKNPLRLAKCLHFTPKSKIFRFFDVFPVTFPEQISFIIPEAKKIAHIVVFLLSCGVSRSSPPAGFDTGNTKQALAVHLSELVS